MRYFITVLLFACVYTETFSQYSLTGVIMSDDPSGKFPVSQIRVSVPELNKSVLANSEGEFRIHDLHPGTYTLKLYDNRKSFFNLIFRNIAVNDDVRLDTLLIPIFYAPIKDLTLGGFGKDVKSMKEYYKDNGLLVYDTSQFNFYSHGYYGGRLEQPVKDSIDHYFRQGEWKWDDRKVVFEKGRLNGPTEGYAVLKKCGYTGFYKNNEPDGHWNFYNKSLNEVIRVEFKEGYLLLDLDSLTIKESNALMKRIVEIY